ncbi:MAG: ribonuclease III [Erysipelotrichaceae bacterium]
MDIYQFLENIGIPCNNRELIQTALVHSSYVNEHKMIKSDNERLEFIGDAVLQLWSAHKLYALEETLSEGAMTTLRAQLVCGESLAMYCKTLGINQFILLGIGEEKTGGRERESILADAFEALLGAVYLDQGFETVSILLEQVITPTIYAPKSEKLIDYKTRLQEYIQADTRKTIRYENVKVSGPSNKPIFEMVVMLDEIILGRGSGSSKKKAEQMAARDAFDKMVK